MPQLTVPNTPEGLKVIADLRKLARMHGYKIDVRGRCKNRQDVFHKTGRRYTPGIANKNDIYLGSPEAPYCHSWALYRRYHPTEVAAYMIDSTMREFARKLSA